MIAMPSMAQDLARALDPALLLPDVGLASDPWQAALLRSWARYVIILASRQVGKTVATGLVALSTALHQPGSLTLILSPAQRQSIEMLRTIQQMHARLKGVPELKSDTVMRAEFANGSRIIALPGSEKTVRGYSGVALAICDEAARCDEALLQAIRPMLATSNGRLIMLSTPAGKRGFFAAAWHGEGDADHWLRIRVTAEECPRITKTFLENEKAELGPQKYSEEFGLCFVDSAEAFFRTDIIDRAFTPEVLPLWI